jgi:hypothetical protein
MNLQSLVVVFLRLMSLNFLLYTALQLPPYLISFLRSVRNAPAGESSADATIVWLMLIGLIPGVVLLWVLAVPIARLVTRRMPQEVSLGTLTLADCYSIAFIGVGLLNISRGLPQILTWGAYLFKLAASVPDDSWKQQVNWSEVARPFILLVAGVVLFIKGRGWAVAPACRHGKPEAPSPPRETV